MFVITPTNTNPVALQIQNEIIPYENSNDLINKEFLLNNINYYITLKVLDNNFDPYFEKLRITSYDVNLGFTNINTVNNINLNIEKDLNDIFLENDTQYNINYIFFKDILESRIDKNYLIQEISNDGTEIRLFPANPIDDFSNIINNYITEFNSREFEPFYISNNLGTFFNECINIAFDQNTQTILIKLSQPINSLDIKSKVYFTEILSIKTYNVIKQELIIEEEIFSPINLIPNFSLDINEQVGTETNFLNLNNLLQNNFSSSFSLQNLISNNVKININYENFEEFVFFSSLEQRIKSFYLKVKTLEDLNNNLLATPNNQQFLVQQETILNNLDDFEKFLYYETGSITFPKTTSTPPYYLQSTGSVESINWYSNMVISGSDYDSSNKDILRNFLPIYVKEQPNETASLFTDLLALNFDKIWVYIKDITNKYNNDNRLNVGVSKDLISEVLKDFGIKIYQNKFSNVDLLTSFLGINNNGQSTYFPNITNQLPVTSSLEYIDNLITGSNFSSQEIKVSDLNARIYKRIYNNISYLSKKKGTLDGLRTLINIYGLPSTIFRLNEFGGKDTNETLDWDYWNDVFNYTFITNISNSIDTPWIVNSSWNSTNNRPETVVLRFKSNLFEPSYSFTNKLWSITDGTNSSYLELNHQPLLTQSLYNGFPLNDDSIYSHLIFYPDSTNLGVTCSVYLPFQNNEWWNVKITNLNNSYSLNVYSSHYNGNDGSFTGFNSSASVNYSTSIWVNSVSSTFNPDNVFDGKLQEFRYYKTLSLTDFINFSLNPFSLEDENNIKDNLIFRANLGTEGNVSSSIIGESNHTARFGIWQTTESFISNSLFIFSYSSSYETNSETLFYNYFNSGIKNPISNKFQSYEEVLPIVNSSLNTNLPAANILQTDISLDQTKSNLNIKDINYLEAGFSFQNEINDDIVSELGYFNIGDYIGDPSERYSDGNSYVKLNQLAQQFFEKYSNKFRINDYSRLLKYIDNSLFKILKDFVPAKTSISTGHIVKQNILERNRYKEPTFENNLIELSASISVGNFNVAEGGFNQDGEYETLELDQFQLSGSAFINTRKTGVFDLVFTADVPISSLTTSEFKIYDGIGNTGEMILHFSQSTTAFSYNRKINLNTNYITIEEVGPIYNGVNFTDFKLVKYQNNLETLVTPVGYVDKINDNDECINGQYPGVITVNVTSPKLNNLQPEITYKQRLYSGSIAYTNYFLSDLTTPPTGYVYLLYQSKLSLNFNGNIFTDSDPGLDGFESIDTM